MSIVERGFDVRDHEIIQQVYQAAWARLAASKPVRTPEEESLRQKFLRKRLFSSISLRSLAVSFSGMNVG